MNIGEILLESYEILKKVQIESYLLDSQLLLAKVLNKDKLFIMLNRDFNLNQKQENEFSRLIQIRKSKMPIKYILGECEFMGMDFIVRPGVLIPRPDTEILVEEVIRHINEKAYTEVCDVCSGSGAIGIAIAEFIKSTKVTLYDIADDALTVAKLNIERFDLAIRVNVENSDLLKAPIEQNKKFEVVVSNPPYIREDVIPTLMDDVKEYEPYIALSGGRDGLDFYRRITEESLQVLKKGGLLAFEIGYDQREEVSNILLKSGFKKIECIKDLAGNDRVIKAILV
ncbi:peptide chain release factor N(5)-glutamine methyltransferase [Clostridium sp. CM028]|uniref:peptide chain release factor N(5)-glutamine methyltransferase n=1 Tax=unclassified Clostridium TaxID=2614128 RepID=UPI001C0BF1CC|nr:MULTISPECIES: peptide chain release factor N(5)-glutamine methyltransferase [unclassified Clostridium]MBU3092573.1 peptide chain release factor N(5)-glutamine methyltransferase [Clostridium sp. CF011]MBW9146226.1 peptide chain release factor N(5)-glutamine methyltransferase [Clostridium sp. CM027]MBW9149698.1 peptide chain release factor N(5)-glutamine methyltransferase [Clostridium sp. CM028]UVE39795.1 peptide chain release factor N(5)-glutamine methyltransferase [Clostridium sp. CM027]WAG